MKTRQPWRWVLLSFLVAVSVRGGPLFLLSQSQHAVAPAVTFCTQLRDKKGAEIKNKESTDRKFE